MSSPGTDPALVFADTTLWPIVDKLCSDGEAVRRETLRPHEDDYTRQPEIALDRAALDRLLNALTQAEIWMECRGDYASFAAMQLPHRKAMLELAGSDSFLRYVNTYLYFGVRTFLRRFFTPCAVVYRDGNARVNREPWWLAIPPPVSEDCRIAVAMPDEEWKPGENVTAALSFLDGLPPRELLAQREGGSFSGLLELWIRELQPELEGQPEGRKLESIARGLTEWAKRQAIFYLVLSGHLGGMSHPLPTRPEKGWPCDTPVVARAALNDLYWIAGLLRTDVTAAGEVTNRTVSWLGLLRFRAALHNCTREQQDLQATEEILRQVFGSCCDLVQNAYELACAEQKELTLFAKVAGRRSRADGATADAESWRAVFDKELDEVSRQRDYREYGQGKQRDGVSSKEAPGWSRHLYTGGTVPDLIGLAFSGGGIRSATFNLGVLEGLQEMDLLRQVDYLSTVSGGGFVGSWLMGNVKRSTYWLGRLTPWDDSISHLRKFSNYLAPRTGILSMDTWSLGALWLRNTLLIQLTALAWMLVLLCSVYLLRFAFLGFASSAAAVGAYGFFAVSHRARLLLFCGRLLLPLLALTTVAELAANLWGSAWRPLYRVLLKCSGQERARARLRRCAVLLRSGYILSLAVLPAWLGAALLAAQEFASAWRSQCSTPLAGPFWKAHAAGLCAASGVEPTYSAIFKSVFQNPWVEYKHWAVLLYTLLSLFVLSLVSLLRSQTRRRRSKALPISGAAGIAVLCTTLVHVCLSAVVLLMQLQIRHLHSIDRIVTLTAIWGPASTLMTYSLAILLLIGLTGRAGDGAQREWWTRYGAWVLGCAVLGFAVPAVVFGSPWFFQWLHQQTWIKWGTIAGWVFTTVAGLLAGRSSRTAGEGATRAPSLQMLANIGGALFLLGAAMGGAELLYFFVRAEASSTRGLDVFSIEATAVCQLLLGTLAVLLACALIFSWRFDLNVFGLSELYRNRLVRCYLGATRWQDGMRRPERFTQFDFHDDLKLSDLTTGATGSSPGAVNGLGFRGPFPIINCSLNLAGSSDLSLHTRHSASFTLSPVHCGAQREHVGYQPTRTFAGGLLLGQAVAVSGAAASPNMGYNTSPLVALLLTLFNVRLGWWFPNPGSKAAHHQGPSGLYYLLLELLGLASERRAYVNVTDGGHFENLGIYELVRRRAQLIIACDAECDETMTFTGLANAIRLCQTDFGAKIELDLASLARGENGLSRTHSAVGLIRYSNGSVGRILYLKASMTGDEDPSVVQYHSSHPTFPHESTANQFFKEEQFESYRRLGHHIVRNALRNVATREQLIRAAERLMDTMTPAASTTEKFLEHTRALEELWQRMRTGDEESLQRNGFIMELMGHASRPSTSQEVTADITCIGLELLQLMENIFIDLRLDDFWEHPDHRGWALLFMNWARSPRFRTVWKQNHHTFGIRFEHFCATRLGLMRDTPVLRVSPLTRD